MLSAGLLAMQAYVVRASTRHMPSSVFERCGRQQCHLLSCVVGGGVLCHVLTPLRRVASLLAADSGVLQVLGCTMSAEAL